MSILPARYLPKLCVREFLQEKIGLRGLPFLWISPKRQFLKISIQNQKKPKKHYSQKYNKDFAELVDETEPLLKVQAKTL